MADITKNKTLSLAERITARFQETGFNPMDKRPTEFAKDAAISISGNAFDEGEYEVYRMVERYYEDQIISALGQFGEPSYGSGYAPKTFTGWEIGSGALYEVMIPIYDAIEHALPDATKKLEEILFDHFTQIEAQWTTVKVGCTVH